MELIPEEWEYIASGSANSVFEYKGQNDKLKGKVLRLRLDGNEFTTLDIYKYLNSNLFDGLREYMIQTTLLKIDNYSLATFTEKKGLKLSLDEEYGLLLKNFYKYPIQEYQAISLNKYYKFFIHQSKNEVVFEFKPKWLYDIPNHHKTCRNCLNAMLKEEKFINCHLKIIDKPSIDSWCEELQGEFLKYNENICITESLKKVLYKNHELIIKLYKLQNNIDIHNQLLNLESEHDITEKLQFNMTLRDISIFINLNTEELSILDLDKKPKSKWRAWKKKETLLQDLYTKDLGLDCSFKAN